MPTSQLPYPRKHSFNHRNNGGRRLSENRLCRCCLVFDQSEASIPPIDQSEAALRSVITAPVTGADIVTMQWSAPGQVRGLTKENMKEGEKVTGTERISNINV